MITSIQDQLLVEERSIGNVVTVDGDEPFSVAGFGSSLVGSIAAFYPVDTLDPRDHGRYLGKEFFLARLIIAEIDAVQLSYVNGLVSSTHLCPRLDHPLSI